MKVLVTRPAHLAQSLCDKIKAMGAIAEPFPVIDIRKTPHQAAVQLAVETLANIDIAIFVSPTAVLFAMPTIQQRWHNWHDLPLVLWTAIGAGTAKALKNYGIPDVLFPATPPYESESLLATAKLQSVDGKRILIFRGNGGRPLLKQVLQKRGAIVQTVEVYQCCLPTINLVEQLSKRGYTSRDIIVTTSSLCLSNLVLLAGEDKSWLKEIPIVVVGSRMYQLAQKLGVKKPFLATGADDTSIVKILTKLQDNPV